jgi:hypothetical protein
MKRKQLLSLSALPNSLVEPLHITSLETGQYNCISWALGITDFPIWPIDEKPYNWPSNLPLIESMENFITFFKMHGFEYCENEKPKKDFELIAIFEKDGLPTHTCRLLKNGYWTSKIGILEDVQHNLFAISGGIYGEPSVFMKKKITVASAQQKIKI